MPWTHFWDMHSGGSQKVDWGHIFIEAPQAEAELVFYNRFGRNPNRVTCTCCGPDYSISESDTLEQATAYNRGCAWVYTNSDGERIDEDEWYTLPLDKRGDGKYVEEQGKKFTFSTYRTLDEYIASGGACIIRASEIDPDERTGDLPEEGYVWM